MQTTKDGTQYITSALIRRGFLYLNLINFAEFRNLNNLAECLTFRSSYSFPFNHKFEPHSVQWEGGGGELRSAISSTEHRFPLRQITNREQFTLILRSYVNSVSTVENFPDVTEFGIETFQENNRETISFPKSKILK